MANTSEGHGRRTNVGFANFLNLARGSAAEAQSHLYAALGLNYINRDDFENLYKVLSEISRMLFSLAQYPRSAKKQLSENYLQLPVNFLQTFMQTWKLEIEYEGTRYRGWQIQETARTVQGEIELAAKDFFKTGLLETGGSGRTDAGVHALSQFAHLRVFKEIPDITPRKLQFALNDRLPHDINIRRVSNAPPKFHARHDAVARYYIYQISTERTAFAKNFVWWVKDRLDLAAMTHAVKFLPGKHDFYSFCDPPTEAVSTLVQIQKAQLFTGEGMILFRIGASHFLWKMVRRIVGSLAEIGRGNLSVREFEGFFTRKTRETAAWTAPPSGLFLERVLYKGDAPPEGTEPVFPIR